MVFNGDAVVGDSVPGWSGRALVFSGQFKFRVHEFMFMIQVPELHSHTSSARFKSLQRIGTFQGLLYAL